MSLLNNFRVIYSKFFTAFAGLVCLSACNTALAAIPIFQAKLNEGATELAFAFPSSNNIVSNFGLLASLFMNTLFIYRFNRVVRVYCSLSIFIAGFTLLLGLSAFKTDTAYKAKLYFGLVLSNAFVLNLTSSILQSVFGALLAYFDMDYINIFLFGEAFSGLIISLFSLVVVSFDIDTKTYAYIFFSFPVVLSILGAVAFFFFQRLKLYKCKVQAESLSAQENNSYKESLANYKLIFLQIWKHALVTFVNFAITLIIFPVLMLRVTSESEYPIWKNKSFLVFHTFVMFNLGDVLGRIPPHYLSWPNKLDNLLILLTFSRILFLPAYLLCNISGSTLPNILKNDVYPILLMLLFAFTNGLYSTIAFSKGSGQVPKNLREQCNTMIIFFLGLGLFTGSFLSFPVSKWLQSLDVIIPII